MRLYIAPLLALLLSFAALPAHAYVVSIDSFSVRATAAAGGIVSFDDPFDDGAPPRSGPNGPVTYDTAGIPVLGTEAGGRLTLDGSDAQPSAFFSFAFESALLASPLAQGSPIGVRGIFDLIQPSVPLETYGLRLTDQFIFAGGVVSPGDDDIRIQVTHRPTGVIAVDLVDVDNTNRTMTLLDSHELTAAELLNAQIQLQLLVGPTGVVTGSFGFGGLLTTFAATDTLFHGEAFTRAGFVATSPVPLPGTLSLLVLALGALVFSRERISASIGCKLAGQHGRPCL
jgi:hypothetical protein